MVSPAKIQGPDLQESSQRPRFRGMFARRNKRQMAARVSPVTKEAQSWLGLFAFQRKCPLLLEMWGDSVAYSQEWNKQCTPLHGTWRDSGPHSWECGESVAPTLGDVETVAPTLGDVERKWSPLLGMWTVSGPHSWECGESVPRLLRMWGVSGPTPGNIALGHTLGNREAAAMSGACLRGGPTTAQYQGLGGWNAHLGCSRSTSSETSLSVHQGASCSPVSPTGDVHMMLRTGVVVGVAPLPIIPSAPRGLPVSCVLNAWLCGIGGPCA